jgi:hypothetical protein
MLLANNINSFATASANRLLFAMMFVFPIQCSGGAGVDTFAAFGAADWQACVEGCSDRGQETAILGTQQGITDDLFAGFYANTAFDTFAGILNDFGMSRINAFGIFSSADRRRAGSAELS